MPENFSQLIFESFLNGIAISIGALGTAVAQRPWIALVFVALVVASIAGGRTRSRRSWR